MRALAVGLLLLTTMGCPRSPMPTTSNPTISGATTRWVRSGDANLYVESVRGRDGGPVLIALHGGPGLSHEYLAGLSSLATPDLRVVFYDQRGVGRSTGTVDGQIAARQVDDLDAVRQAFGAERVHLLGHSAGGLLLMQYLRAHPERVASAVFVDSASPTKADLDAALGRFGARINELTQSGVLPRQLPEPRNGDGTPWLQAVLPAYFHNTQHPAARSLNGARYTPRVLNTIVSALGDFDFRSALAGLQGPALAFTAPVPFGVEMAQPVAAALPAERVETVTVESCGHMVWIECPDQFFPRTRAFLERVTR